MIAGTEQITCQGIFSSGPSARLIGAIGVGESRITLALVLTRGCLAITAGVVIKSKKNGGREELSFKRSGWRPARIDVSEAGIQSYSKQESEDQTRKDLRFVFDMLDSSTNDGIITEQDLSRQFRRLHYAPEEGEVKGIIWEVDDDNDGGINWREFVNLYKRVKDDEVGIEPRRFYTLIVFLTFDLDADGLVSLNGVYARTIAARFARFDSW